MYSGTLDVYEKFLQDTCGLIPGVHYEHHINRKMISYWNGCKDYLFSADDPDSIRGPTVARAWLDEGGYMVQKAFENASARLRQPGYPQQLWVTTTPVSKRSWLFRFFYPREAYEGGYITESDYLAMLDRPDRYLAYNPKTRDNPFVSRAYYLSLLANYGGEKSLLARRELEGEFILMDGLVYENWETDTYLKDRSEWPEGCRDPKWRPDKIAMAVDYGSHHKSAIQVAGVDHFGRTFFLDEWSKPSSPPEVAKKAAEMAEKWNPTWCFAEHDPAWFRPLRDALRKKGVRVVRADKHYGMLSDTSGGGIGLFNHLLNDKLPDGSQKLWMDKATIVHLPRELENYQWPKEIDGKPFKETPLKVADDNCDTARYLVTGMAARRWYEPDRVTIINVRSEFLSGVA